MKAELLKVVKSKKSILLIALYTLFPIYDAYLSFRNDTLFDYFKHKSSYDSIEYAYRLTNHPTMAGFLSGITEGHIAQMICFWLMPLFLLGIYCDKTIQEKTNGYNNIIFARSSRKNEFNKKTIMAFFVSFLTMFIAIAVNFFIVYILFHNGKSFAGMEMWEADSNPNHIFGQWQLDNPYLAYGLFTFSTCFVSGLCGVICYITAYLFPKYYVAYPLCFVIWCKCQYKNVQKVENKNVHYSTFTPQTAIP